MTRWGILAVVSVLLVLPACGSSDDTDDATADAGSTTTSVAAVDGEIGSTDDPGDDAAQDGDASEGEATSGDPAGAPDTTVASGGVAPKPAESGGTQPPAADPPPDAPTGFAAAGIYRYDRTDNRVVEVTVDPPSGNRQHSSSRVDGSLIGEQTLEIRSDGAYLVMIRQVEAGVDKRFQVDPPALASPANPTTGQQWSWSMTSDDGLTTVDTTSTVEGFETLTVGGTSVDTVRIKSVSKISGDFSGTQTSTRWISIERGLLVRSDDHIKGTFGAIPVEQSSSQVLTNLDPA